MKKESVPSDHGVNVGNIKSGIESTNLLPEDYNQADYSTVRCFLIEQYGKECGKKLVNGKSYSGSVIHLICKSTSESEQCQCKFRIQLQKFASGWKLSELTDLRHGIVDSQGRESNCLGTYKATISEARSAPVLNRIIKDGNHSFKGINGIAHDSKLLNLSVNQVKKLVAETKVSDEQHDEDFRLIESYLKKLKEMNSNLDFKYVEKNGKFDQLFVVFPWAKEAMRHTLPVLSTDGSNNAAIELQIGFIPKSTLLISSTRTNNMDNLILAFAIVIGGETQAAYSTLLELCNKNGLPINKADLTYFTDRAIVILNALKIWAYLALHMKCLRHLGGNIKSNRAFLPYFDLFRHASLCKSKSSFEAVMREILEKCPKLHEYLSNIESWARYEAVERGNMHFNITTNNIAEQCNAWLKSCKGNPYLFLRNIVSDCFANNMRLRAELPSHHDKLSVTLYASAQFEINLRASHEWDSVTITRNLCGIVTMSNSPITVKSYSVNVSKRECSCAAWQMVGIPCQHALALIRVLNKRNLRPILAPTLYYDCWQMRKYTKLLDINEMYGILPGDDDIE